MAQKAAIMANLMESQIYDWQKIAAEPTKTGQRRGFFNSATGTLDRMSCHVTTLNPGERAHEPHRHPEEEIILVKDGVLEALLNEKTQTMGAGSLFFIAPQDLHGVRNAGETPATYFVFKWWPATRPASQGR
jgi:quercetin dioxygenase-like cupin family protein